MFQFSGMLPCVIEDAKNPMSHEKKDPPYPPAVVCDEPYCPIRAIRNKLGRERLTRAKIETAASGKEVTVSDIPDAGDLSRVAGISIKCNMGIDGILSQEGKDVRDQFQEPRFPQGSGGGVVFARI